MENTNLFDLIQELDADLDMEQVQEVADYVDTQNIEEDFWAIYEIVQDVLEAYEILERQDYSFYPDINDYDELGEYIVDEGLWGEVPENLVPYLDYEKIGRDIALNSSGGFVEGGYLELF